MDLYQHADARECTTLQDFQFFNQGRLTEIYAKEAAYENFRWQQAQKKDAALKQVSLLIPTNASPDM